MKFSSILYYYVILPSLVGGFFKLIAWGLHVLKLASIGEWAFTAGFVISLILIRPKNQWKAVEDSEFRCRIDFPGEPERAVQDYDNGVRSLRLSYDLNNSAFILQALKIPEGLARPDDEVIVQAEAQNVGGRLSGTSDYRNGSISGKCYCLAFTRNEVNYFMHLLISTGDRFQYQLIIISPEKEQN
jgi:hypothetical protein